MPVRKVSKVKPTKTVERREVSFTIPAVKAPKAINGFVHFIRQQGVIGLAIGFVVGADAKTVVDSLTSNIFNPLIGLATGNVNLNNEHVCLKSAHHVCTAPLNYGAVLSTLLSFLIALFLLYLLLRALKLDKFDKKAE